LGNVYTSFLSSFPQVTTEIPAGGCSKIDRHCHTGPLPWKLTNCTVFVVSRKQNREWRFFGYSYSTFTLLTSLLLLMINLNYNTYARFWVRDTLDLE